MTGVQSRLSRTLLYLVTPARPAYGDLDRFLALVLEAGVDMVQLRDKQMEADELKPFGEIVRKRTSEHGALFIINDSVEAALACGADGVHLGQDDMPVGQARSLMGAEALIGLSTHSEAEVLRSGESGADYIGVGPVYETPTKAGRPAVGLGLVSYAAAETQTPFFAIGGIDLSNLRLVQEAGATRVSVLRALTDAGDPAAVAGRIKRSLLVGSQA